MIWWPDRYGGNGQRKDGQKHPFTSDTSIQFHVAFRITTRSLKIQDEQRIGSAQMNPLRLGPIRLAPD
jgi:hypothetical protein